MSSGPTLTGSRNPKEKFRTYYHLHLTKKDWCTYFKDCPMENNITGQWCWICKHARPVDVPDLLMERGRNNK
jgi:hypothetical protein